jgi:hypothetical protein
MTIRERLKDGQGRGIATLVVPILFAVLTAAWLPSESGPQRQTLESLQKIAFIAAAFAVTAYNLRTRVVDFALRATGPSDKVEEFCRLARISGQRLTNLVIRFTATAVWLGAITFVPSLPLYVRSAAALGVFGFTSSIASFVYILFAFERIERFALDNAELAARANEARDLLKRSSSTSQPACR